MNLLRYDIYIGCNDKDTYNEQNTLEYVKNQISELLSKEQIGFSITNQLGGYVYEDSTYIIENSLKITLIANFEELKLALLINALKHRYNQNTILVVKQDINVKYDKERNK